MRTVVAFVCIVTLYSCSKKDADTATDGMYFPQVKKIIQNNCMSCHNSAGSWQGRPTQFDTDEDITRSYASIKAAVADPETFVNKRMPQGGSLSQADIDIIVKWFEKGGKTTD